MAVEGVPPWIGELRRGGHPGPTVRSRAGRAVAKADHCLGRRVGTWPSEAAIAR